MKKLLIAFLVVGYLLLIVALLQDYFGSPTFGCKKFSTGTSYTTGYKCKNKTFYILN